MGRPLNKHKVGLGTGKLKLRVKIGARSETDGFIVRQKGSKKFIVAEVADSTKYGVCTLVKNTGSLGNNECSLLCVTDDSTSFYASKITNRFVWNFAITKDTSNSVALGATTIPFADTTDIVAGQLVSGTGIAPGSHVVSVVTNTSIVVSLPTTAAMNTGSTISFVKRYKWNTVDLVDGFVWVLAQ